MDGVILSMFCSLPTIFWWCCIQPCLHCCCVVSLHFSGTRHTNVWTWFSQMGPCEYYVVGGTGHPETFVVALKVISVCLEIITSLNVIC